ncbi:Fur family transcriptional regulator [Barnesiella viscericola]|uniref:Fur family transcriptional regulator n=1 Tax=Barnesiella viscericola TaxID=397865 RepID=UPI0024B6EA96|nr:transcriptional repressor [Barnesiella viscericola]
MKETAQNRLRRYNIKPSVQRMAVLDYLMTHHTHPTADTIFNALYPSIPTLSKATVYNTLNLLTEQGVIQMITIDEKNARFDARETPHLHFRCTECGEIFDFDLPPFQMEMPKDFEISDIQMYCKGVCPSCQKKKYSINN